MCVCLWADIYICMLHTHTLTYNIYSAGVGWGERGEGRRRRNGAKKKEEEEEEEKEEWCQKKRERVGEKKRKKMRKPPFFVNFMAGFKTK